MRRITSFFIAGILLITCFNFAVNAAGTSMDNATPISFGSSYSGTITDSDCDHYYKFTLSSSGRIDLRFSGDIGSAYLYVYSADGDLIWNDDDAIAGSNQATLNYTDTLDLASGTYYFHVHERYSGCTGNYSFTMNYTDAKESFKDIYGGADNFIEYANDISFNQKYNGQIAIGDKDDYYAFTLSSSGRINLQFSGNIGSAYLYIYSADGDLIWNDDDAIAGSNQATLNYKDTLDLASGTYYFHVHERYSGCTGNYSFSISNDSTPPPAEHNTTPPVDHPTQSPDSDPIYDAPEDVTDSPVDIVEPDDDYIIPDTDSDIDITINIYLDFEYTVINNYVVIVNYIGGDTYVTIPEYIENYTVVGIGKRAFKDKGVETVYVPSTVTQFGEEAFDDSVVLECIMGSAAETYAINNGFAHTLTSNEIDDSPSPIGPIILVAAVVAIVAVAGVVAVIIIGKKKSVA